MTNIVYRLEYADIERKCWIVFEERKHGFVKLQYAIDYRDALIASVSKKWADYVWRIVEVTTIERVV